MGVGDSRFTFYDGCRDKIKLRILPTATSKLLTYPYVPPFRFRKVQPPDYPYVVPNLTMEYYSIFWQEMAEKVLEIISKSIKNSMSLNRQIRLERQNRDEMKGIGSAVIMYPQKRAQKSIVPGI